MTMFDKDHMRWRLTDTALLRADAPPVFLAPHLWPQRVWSGCVLSQDEEWWRGTAHERVA